MAVRTSRDQYFVSFHTNNRIHIYLGLSCFQYYQFKMKEQLTTIFSMLEEEFQHKKCMPSPSKTQKSYNYLENQNRVLIYEIRIYKKIMNILSQSLTQQDSQFLQQTAKSEVNHQILTQNLQLVTKSEEQMRNELNKTRNELIGIRQQLQRKDKYIRIYQQKCNEYQRLGGSQKIKDLKRENDMLKKQREEYEQKMNEQKQKSKMYMEKCKILENLNKETENQLAEYLVSGTRKTSNENTQNFSNIELMAAKQQIKQLKSTISSLKLQKQQILRKHNKKEALYSRMIDKREQQCPKVEMKSTQRVSRQKIR